MKNGIQVTTDDYKTSSSSEQNDSSSSSSSSSSSTMSEMAGRRIYCSGRDLHTISSVSCFNFFYLFKFKSFFLLIKRMFFPILIYLIWN